MADQSSNPKRYTPPQSKVASRLPLLSILPLILLISSDLYFADFATSSSIFPFAVSSPPYRKSSANSRKSGDRTCSQKNNDGEKNQPLTTGLQMEDNSRRIITPNSCSRSEAYQLLSERWAAAMHQYNDPTVDLSERPIMYYGGSVWGKLPHQILAAANKTLPPQSISPTRLKCVEDC